MDDGVETGTRTDNVAHIQRGLHFLADGHVLKLGQLHPSVQGVHFGGGQALEGVVEGVVRILVLFGRVEEGQEGKDVVAGSIFGPEAVLRAEAVLHHVLQVVLVHFFLKNVAQVVAQLDIHRMELLATLRQRQPEKEKR